MCAISYIYIYICLYRLIHAFKGANISQLALNIVNHNPSGIPSLYSRGLARLLSALLSKDPRLRPNVDQILALPLLRSRIPHSYHSSSIAINRLSRANLNFLSPQKPSSSSPQSGTKTNKSTSPSPALKHATATPSNKPYRQKQFQKFGNFEIDKKTKKDLKIYGKKIVVPCKLRRGEHRENRENRANKLPVLSSPGNQSHGSVNLHGSLNHSGSFVCCIYIYIIIIIVLIRHDSVCYIYI